MPRMCSVCRSEHAKYCTEMLINNAQSYRSLAAHTGLSPASLHRHKTICVPRLLKEGREARERAGSPKPYRSDLAALAVQVESDRLLGATEIVLKVQALVSESLALLEQSKAAGDRQSALRCLREARDGLSLLGKAQGFWNDSSVVIDQRQQTVELNDLSPFLTNEELLRISDRIDAGETVHPTTLQSQHFFARPLLAP